MITLKMAMSLRKEEIEEVKLDLLREIARKKDLNAYVEVPSMIDSDFGKIPVLVKDNICVKNERVECCSAVLRGFVSPYDATVIGKIRSNGMCAFGRGNMDEFGMGSTTTNGCYGRARNPIDPLVTPGGSSGGCAAGVGAGIAIASLGSDTGGSVRQPASHCGVVGLKPSYGRVSRHGLIAYSSSLEQIGPITQNVEDASILLDTISGRCGLDSTCMDLNPTCTYRNLDARSTYKIATFDKLAGYASKSVKDAYYEILKILERMGHKLIEKSMIDLQYQVYAYYTIAAAEASANMARYDGVRYGSKAERENATIGEMYSDYRNSFGSEVKRRVMLGAFVLSSGYYDSYYAKAQKIRKTIEMQYETIFKECDLIVSPVAPGTAAEHNKGEGHIGKYLDDMYTIGSNLAGLPSISIPVSLRPLPIGIQFIGKCMGEQSVLNAAYGLERELSLQRKV